MDTPGPSEQLRDALDRIDASCQRIKRIKFAAPGMFTRAVICEPKPKITELLRDPSANEALLYHVDPSVSSQARQMVPRRIDGHLVLLAPSPEAARELLPNEAKAPIVPVAQVDDNALNNRDSVPNLPYLLPVTGDADQDLRSAITLVTTRPNLFTSRDQPLARLKAEQETLRELELELQELQAEYDHLDAVDVVTTDEAAEAYASKLIDDLKQEIDQLEHLMER